MNGLSCLMIVFELCKSWEIICCVRDSANVAQEGGTDMYNRNRLLQLPTGLYLHCQYCGRESAMSFNCQFLCEAMLTKIWIAHF